MWWMVDTYWYAYFESSVKLVIARTAKSVKAAALPLAGASADHNKQRVQSPKGASSQTSTLPLSSYPYRPSDEIRRDDHQQTALSHIRRALKYRILFAHSSYMLIY
jgi:hypothetical protein